MVDWPKTPDREFLAKLFDNNYDMVRRFETLFDLLQDTVPTDVEGEIAAINATLAAYAANFTTAVLVVTTSAQLDKIGVGITPATQTATGLEIKDKGTPQQLTDETGNVDVNLRADSNRTATDNKLFTRDVYWNGTLVGEIAFYSGDDTANKDDGYLTISTAEGGVLTPWLRIEQNGNTLFKGVVSKKQETPNAEVAAVTLTAEELLNGINTGTHATGANINFQLPTGTLMDAAVLFENDDSFDWSLINLSAAAADTITITAGVDHTVVGVMVVQSAHATTGGLYGNAARFRTRKTAANTFVTYRIG